MGRKLSLLLLSLAGFWSSTNAAPYSNFSALNVNANAAYLIQDTFTASNFWSGFNFFTAGDPTHGFVKYQSQAAAQSAGLTNSNNNQIYLGVDHTTVNPSGGRASVRISSNKAYTHGLFIADIAHMPGAACGVWPAFWMFGPQWPSNGEIDIIEGVNLATTNTITLHAGKGCSINIAGSQAGTTLLQSDCNKDSGNTGCGTSSTAANAYGDSFNRNGGGVYAMQWESTGIYVWFFPRNKIPADITAGNPVTGNWGLPIVAFNGGSSCKMDSFFKNQNIVFDTTFCGDWAGSVWASTKSCSSLARTCEAYVGANPGAFAPAYWLINSVKVYSTRS